MQLSRRPRHRTHPDLTVTDQLFTRPTYRQPPVPAPTTRLDGVHPDELRRGDHVMDPTHPRGGLRVAMLISGAADGTVVVVPARTGELSTVYGPDVRLTVHRPTS